MKRQRYLDENGNFQFIDEMVSSEDTKPATVPANEQVTASPEPMVKINKYNAEDLQVMLIVELRAIAKKEGIKFSKKSNKVDLIELILGK